MNEPIEALQLVFTELAVSDDGGLDLETMAGKLSACFFVSKEFLVFLFFGVSSVSTSLLLLLGGIFCWTDEMSEEIGLLEEEFYAFATASSL